MYRSSSSSSTRLSDDFHSHKSHTSSSSSSQSSKSSTFKPIPDVIEQLPTYNPQSYVAKKEFDRLRSAESAIHLIPLLIVFCGVILWLFSGPALDVDL